MSNIKIQTIPTAISLTNAHLSPRVVWSGSDVRTKSTYTPTHGTKLQQVSDNAWNEGSVTKSIYCDTYADGFKIQVTSGKSHQVNHEFHGDGRWMPATHFDGFSCALYQSSGSQHALYLNFYSLVFVDDIGSYRIWGVVPSDAHNSGPRSGTRSLNFNNSSDINTIRGWGKSWKFQGIIIHLVTNGGIQSGQSSYFQLTDVKVAHRSPIHSGDTYRMVPPKIRSFSDRALTVTGTKVGFTDPIL